MLGGGLVKLLLLQRQLGGNTLVQRSELSNLALKVRGLQIHLRKISFALLKILLNNNGLTLGSIKQLLKVLALGSKHQAFSLSLLQFLDINIELISALLLLCLVLFLVFTEVPGH